MNTLTGFIVFLIIALVFGYLCHITAERKISKARAELKAAEERGRPYSEEVASYMMGQPGIIAIFFAFISFLSFIASLYNLVYWFFP
ncbi:TPA: hypothetical protein ACWZU0_001963 [Klebsiella oxytoca]|jgi:hypothetical protein|uniref:hypothetical protein n=1 Tax=Klebsiella pasteurii TaxID=2587529 RepID=UPI00155F7082|nr:hypothetical protein [Klebsiella michiganensis]